MLNKRELVVDTLFILFCMCTLTGPQPRVYDYDGSSAKQAGRHYSGGKHDPLEYSPTRRQHLPEPCTFCSDIVHETHTCNVTLRNTRGKT